MLSLNKCHLKGAKSCESLPRLVEEPLKTKNNFYCRLCTQSGTLQVQFDNFMPGTLLRAYFFASSTI